MELNVFDFYSRCLIPLTPPDIISKMLSIVMTGGETTDDFVKILQKDPELTHWVRISVQRMGSERRAKTLEQMITLLGQNRVRDLILGRNIERRYVPESQHILTLLKNKPVENVAPTETKEGEAAPETSEDISANESIPNLSDFQGYLSYAHQAENCAISARNSYPGQAFAGGVIFDFVASYLKQIHTDKLSDDRLQSTDKFLHKMFENGVRCGLVGNEIIQKISIPHQKNVFVSGLLHNIGKILLLIYDPVTFEKSFQRATHEDPKERLPSDTSEEELFAFDHAQAGSLYLGRIPFLADVERSIDYHHHPHLLRFTDPPLYALSCVLKVSGNLEKSYQRSRIKNPDAENIKDQKITNMEEFKFLKLDADDWTQIKSNYVLKLMKLGL